MEKKTYSVYVHKVNTENGPMYYTGVTTNLNQRWIPSGYKSTSLWQYIEQYGWDNIEHIVVFETDDREKALKNEDMLIYGYAALGRCINYQRSGLVSANEKEYRNNQYCKHRDDRLTKAKKYRELHHDEIIEYHKLLRLTPQGRIYNRVTAFNQKHPDLAVETPLEAKRKYIESGGTIIPQYIKHDDL